MTEIISVILLTAAVGVVLLCSLGVLVSRDVFDRLHFVGPIATIAAPLVAVAIVLQEAFNQRGIKAILVAALLIVTGPVLAHATARAARVRQFDHWNAFPEEKVE